MEKKTGLVLALATLTLAAGIGSASAATTTCATLDSQLQQIQTISLASLKQKLGDLRQNEPDCALIPTILSKIVEKEREIKLADLGNSDGSTNNNGASASTAPY